ncbi:cytochrome C [Frigidibacter sp. RF13]|uniref:c-type cytochrome n=1 Tax=Frigidibacter sp. RF13 TaxID=2997340 RepID=UPI0022715DEE|nr:cytochrome C [Frigidibacter sp. RF13]MCY1128286.1 cytochrome C [Frigidibacter sp. RF13]
MLKTTALFAFSLFVAAPALAGDPVAGEADFKKCKACHSIIAADGTEIVKGGKTGPSLWGLDGKTVGTAADFKYGDSIVAVGAAGATWNEAEIAAYVTDPTAWLKEKLGDDSAKSKMTFKLAKGAEDIAAYLVTLK